MSNGNYTQKPGSKQTDTKGGFSTKQTDTISKLRGAKEIEPKLGKQIYEGVKQRTKPDKIDSIAVARSNYARKNLGVDSNWSDIADTVEKKYGKLDLSNYKQPKTGGTSGDAYHKRKEYGLDKKKK